MVGVWRALPMRISKIGTRVLLRLFPALVLLAALTPACGQTTPEVIQLNVQKTVEAVTNVPPPPPPLTHEAWQAAARQDLAAIQYSVALNTMIMFDEVNPSYRAWLAEGYKIATERAKEVDGPNSYHDLLTSYVDGFRDPHFFLNSGIDRPVEWPGFLVSWVNNKAVVIFGDAADKNLPPVGSVISACDGEAIETLVTKRVFPITYDPRTVFGQRQAVSRLFLDLKGGLIPAIKACDFQHGESRWSGTLSWRSIPEPSEDFWSRTVIASAGTPAQFGVTFPVEGVAWIGLPTFFDNPMTQPKLKALFDQLSTTTEKMQNGRAIVIDLRGNSGGDLELPAKFAEAIFGWPAVRRMVNSGMGTSTDWRASPENQAYVQSLSQNPRMRDIAQRLALALTQSEPYWREGRQNTSETSGLTERRPLASRRSPFPARIYLLSDGTCISACLAFVDIALQVPGTRLIGADTGGDTGYTSVRSETLPSGLAQFSFPMTFVHKRGRGPMEIYKADVAYTGVRDDQSVRRWTLDLVIRESAVSP